MDPKENMLAAIHFEKPKYVPRIDQGVVYEMEFEGNFKFANRTDLWGTKWEMTKDDCVPFPKEHPLSDLARIDDYLVPDPELLRFTDEKQEQLKKARKQGKLVFGRLSYFIIERAWSLVGMENLLVAMIERPDLVHNLFNQISGFNIRIFQRYLELGVDGISFTEDLGSQKALMISPSMFRSFLLPYYKKCFSPVVAEKKLINFHSCGCIEDIIEDLCSIGVNLLNPIQAQANDLELVRAKSQGKMCLMGGIDTQYTLTRGTPSEVKAEVISRMYQLGKNGGYIVGPDQEIKMPDKNRKVLNDTAIEYGKYPLVNLETVF